MPQQRPYMWESHTPCSSCGAGAYRRLAPWAEVPSFEPRLYLFSSLPDCIDVFHDRAGQLDCFFVVNNRRYGYLVWSKGIGPLATGPHQHGIFVVIVVPTKLSIEIGQHLGDVFFESDTGP